MSLTKDDLYQRVNEYEAQADQRVADGRDELTVEALAREAGEPNALVALCVIIDRARALHSQGQRYQIGEMMTNARELRLGLVNLIERYAPEAVRP